MSYSDRNHRKPWTPADIKEVKNLAAGNTPTRVIGFKMGRTEDSIRNLASVNIPFFVNIGRRWRRPDKPNRLPWNRLDSILDSGGLLVGEE